MPSWVSCSHSRHGARAVPQPGRGGDERWLPPERHPLPSNQRAGRAAALQAADTGAVHEGSVGAGVGTIAFGWKGGIGTASRVLPDSQGAWTVGVLVQSNFGGDHPLGRTGSFAETRSGDYVIHHCFPSHRRGDLQLAVHGHHRVGQRARWKPFLWMR